MYCPSCACGLPAVARFCVRCGAPTGFVVAGSNTLPDIGLGSGTGSDRAGGYVYCGKCGTKVIEGNQFCTACSNPLRAEIGLEPAPLEPAPLHTHSIPEWAGMASLSQQRATASQASSTFAQKEAPKTPIPIATEAISESRKAKFPEIKASPSNTQAKGSLFVVPPGGLLPNRCVKCGAVPSEPWLDLTYSWHHPGLFLLLISPIIYLIVSLVVAKKVTLSVPLCSVHKEIRRERLWTGWLLLIACIPLPVAMAAYIANDAAATVALLLGLTLAIVGIGFLRAAAPLRATHIGPASAEFSGACPDVLDAMEQASEHGVSVTQPIPEVKDDTEPRTEIDQEAARIIREAEIRAKRASDSRIGVPMQLLPDSQASSHSARSGFTWIPWPRINSFETAREAAGQGVAAAGFSCLVTLVAAMISITTDKPVLGMSGWSLIDVALFGVIAWRIYRLSLPWSVIGLLLYTVEKVQPLIEGDSRQFKNPIVVILLIMGYINAIRGTMFVRRQRTANRTDGMNTGEIA